MVVLCAFVQTYQSLSFHVNKDRWVSGNWQVSVNHLLFFSEEKMGYGEIRPFIYLLCLTTLQAQLDGRFLNIG